ncbi:MAG TPA: transposase [Candidatus Bathyarchaeia archaeon]|jgi:putative transposase|nr:transposase [Candidatus Bathyarchaeia archaeon]
MANFHRAPNRLDPASYLGFQEYFLTLCTDGKQKLFTNPALVDSLLATLRETCSVHHFAISAYCFMPDHLHLLAQAKSKTCDLPVFVKAFKGRAAVGARRLGIRNLWQKGYYDHVARDSESSGEIAWYIFLNPVRARLASSPWEWPHSGSFVFDWKQLPVPAKTYTPHWKTQNQKLAT